MSNLTKWNNLDPSKRGAFERAITFAAEGTVLVDNVVNRAVQMLSNYYLGAVSTLERKPGSGSASLITTRTPNATLAQWVADGSGGTDEVGDYARVTWSYKTLATSGVVNRFMQAAGASYINIIATELQAKVEDMMEELEGGFWNGLDASNQPLGMFRHYKENVTGQIISSGTGTGDALDLAKLDETIDAVKGSANRSDLIIFTSQAGARYLNAKLQGSQQFTNVTEIAAGFRVRTYDGIPIVVSSQISATQLWTATNWAADADFTTGGASTSIWVVNKRHVWIEELTPMTVLPLAKTSSGTDSFDIYWDGCPVVANDLGAAVLGGITS